MDTTRKKATLFVKFINVLFLVCLLYVTCTKYWFSTNEDLVYCFNFAEIFGGVDPDDNYILRDAYDSVMEGGLKFHETYWAVGLVEEMEDVLGGNALKNAQHYFHWIGFIGIAMIGIDILLIIFNRKYYITQIVILIFFLMSLWICHRYNDMLEIYCLTYFTCFLSFFTGVLNVFHSQLLKEQQTRDSVSGLQTSTVPSETQEDEFYYAWIWIAGKKLIDSPFFADNVVPMLAAIILYTAETIQIINKQISIYDPPIYIQLTEAVLIGYGVIYAYCKVYKYLLTLIVRRHIVGGANRTLISVKTPSRSCRIGT